MTQIIAQTTEAPSIVIIQGAYDLFCTSAETNVAQYNYIEAVGFALPAKQYTALSTAPPVEEWLAFKRLVEDWRRERGAMSSITEAALCPAYQSIIGMGAIAIPFILAQLQSEGDDPDQWFWALMSISRADPVKDADRGNYAKMAKSWFEWADKNDAW